MLPSQLNGVQLTVVALQDPAAHCPATVSVCPLPVVGHDGGEQGVPSEYFSHAPAAVQAPSLPQLAGP